MHKLKHLFSLMLLLGSFAFGSPPATADNQEKEVPRLQQLTPETVNDLQVFTGAEKTIQDSLQVAEDFVTNAELKDLLANAQTAIKDRPDKNSSGVDWLSWGSSVLLILGAALGYVVRYIQKRNATNSLPGSNQPYNTADAYKSERERRYS